MKTIYLGEYDDCIEWSTIQELKEFFAEYNISIGDNVDIGNKCCIGCDVSIGKDSRLEYGVHLGRGTTIENNTVIGEAVIIGQHVRIMSYVEIDRNTKIEYQTTIGEWTRIGMRVSINHHTSISNDNNIGYNVSIGHDASTGDGVSIGNNVTIPVRTKIPSSQYIKHIITYYNTYRYNASVWEHDGELFIAMGCYTRTESEWDNDFWNNTAEFPEGSEEGDRRLEAYHNIVKLGHQIFKEKI